MKYIFLILLSFILSAFSTELSDSEVDFHLTFISDDYIENEDLSEDEYRKDRKRVFKRDYSKLIHLVPEEFRLKKQKPDERFDALLAFIKNNKDEKRYFNPDGLLYGEGFTANDLKKVTEDLGEFKEFYNQFFQMVTKGLAISQNDEKASAVLRNFRSCARYLNLLSKVHLINKRYASSLKTILQNLQYAHSVERSPDSSLIMALVSNAITGIANASAQEFIWHDGVNKKQLLFLQDYLRRFQFQKQSYLDSLIGEFNYSFIGICALSDNPKVLEMQTRFLGVGNLEGHNFDKNDFIQDFVKLHKAIHLDFKQVYFTGFSQIDSVRASLKKKYGNVGDSLTKVFCDSLLISNLYKNVLRRAYATMNRQRLTQLSLAMRLYQIQFGALPAHLEALKFNGFIEDVPLDTITGKPFTYDPKLKILRGAGNHESRNYELKLRLTELKPSKRKAQLEELSEEVEPFSDSELDPFADPREENTGGNDKDSDSFNAFEDPPEEFSEE